MSEEITITKEDLVLWLDRPPSNDDLDLCEYLANAVQNRQKYYEENRQLKEKVKWYKKENKHNQKIIIKDTKVLDEIREQLKKIKPDLDFEPWSIYKVSGDKLFDLSQILDKVKE